MKHWTEDDFLRWLYVGDEDAAHLNACAQCRARANEMREIRRQASAPPPLSAEFLAAQRRNIYGRLGEGTRSLAIRWAAAMASLVCIVALSLTLLHPWGGKPELFNSSDEKLFSDLASIEQSSEPRAIRPIHNLFQE